MIYLYQILRQIRLDKQYNANAIARAIHVSYARFLKLETEFTVLAPTLLSSWLLELDISERDHAWFIQKNEREYHYISLVRSFPHLDRQFLERMADTLCFYNGIPYKQELDAQLMKHTLPHIILCPKIADVAVDALKEAK